MDGPFSEEIKKLRPRRPLYLILENVLDTYNIGGFFRLADAVGAEKIYLCGGSATPPDPKIIKASVGTYKLVPWEYKKTASEAVQELKAIKRMRIIAVEQSSGSLDYRDIAYRLPVAFLFGNETSGLSDEALNSVDGVAEVPMYGINKSLNVMVAAGVVLYRALERWPRRLSSRGI